MRISKYWLILFAICVFVLWPLFKPGFFKSHDGELHLARIAAYSKALRGGQFPVRWAADLNYGYGYPIFNFVYPLPYLVSSIFYLLGFSLAGSLKVTLALSMILSAIFMFKAMEMWTKDKSASFLSALLYLLAPYRLLDTYVRVALGEAVSFIFPPLAILGFLVWQKRKRIAGWLLMVLSLTGLVLSHNALSIIFLGFLAALFILEARKKKKDFLWIVIGIALSLALSAFFWLPALLELKYTLAKYYLSQKDFHDYFVGLKDLIYMPWGFTKEETPTFLGASSILVFVLFCWQLLKRKIDRLRGFILLGIWLASIFLVNRLSTLVWEELPIIQFFQTPWRFLSLNVLITALMVGFLIKSIKKNTALVVLLMIVVLTLSLPRIRVSCCEEADENFYLNYPKSTTWHNEGSPIWTAGEADRHPEKPVEILGKGKVKDFVKKQTKHQFVIEAEEDVKIIDNTVYFPGWRVTVDGRKKPIQFQNPNFRGLITFNVEKGIHDVNVVFGRTKVRLIGELVSLAAFLGLLTMFFILKINKKFNFNL